MKTVYSPIESEFESAQQEQNYQKWLVQKVTVSMAKAADPSTPRYTTDQVKQRMGATIQAAQARHASRHLA